MRNSSSLTLPSALSETANFLEEDEQREWNLKGSDLLCSRFEEEEEEEEEKCGFEQ